MVQLIDSTPVLIHQQRITTNTHSLDIDTTNTNVFRSEIHDRTNTPKLPEHSYVIHKLICCFVLALVVVYALKNAHKL